MDQDQRKMADDIRVVRVHLNRDDEGTLWWAEDDFGFTGGAETLRELKATIFEALEELEGIDREHVHIELVDDLPASRKETVARVVQWRRGQVVTSTGDMRATVQSVRDLESV